MEKKKNDPKTVYALAYAAAIAAIYVVLTMLFLPISFGPVQFRISEILCILPYFTPAAVPGLFIGCFLSNLFGGAAVMDVVFGSLATLIGGVPVHRKGEPVAGMPAADPGEHDHHPLGAALRLRIHGPDPLCHGNGGDRGDPGHRGVREHPFTHIGSI